MGCFRQSAYRTGRPDSVAGMCRHKSTLWSVMWAVQSPSNFIPPSAARQRTLRAFYAIKTVGRCDFHGKLQGMTAHPKLDPDTDELFAFRYGLSRPFLSYFRFDPISKKLPDDPVTSLDRLSLFHDFAITKRYAIFFETQIGVSTIQRIKGGGPPIAADLSKVPRLGILPRYANEESQIVWLDAPGFNMLHPNRVAALVDGKGSDKSPARDSVETPGLIDELGSCCDKSVLCRKEESVCIWLGSSGGITGVAKLDLDEENGGVSGIRMYGQGCYGGEPFFLARDPDNAEAEEDDGCLATYNQDETTGESRFLVMDAKSSDLDIVAAVKLPQRVPYGFHSIFVRDEDLDGSFMSE
uniref:Uncharacterized protein n=1 Tax=Kalanchoe fedtschenkoi TaxID=63787 RepID=A0A7N0TAU2_KALFE